MSILHTTREKKRKLTMVTAYDYPSALHVCRAGMDMVLIGDSVGMVVSPDPHDLRAVASACSRQELICTVCAQVLGYDTTQPVTVDEMLHHCKAVKRGSSTPLIIADLPFGSYEVSPAQALEVHCFCLCTVCPSGWMNSMYGVLS